MKPLFLWRSRPSDVQQTHFWWPLSLTYVAYLFQLGVPWIYASFPWSIWLKLGLVAALLQLRPTVWDMPGTHLTDQPETHYLSSPLPAFFRLLGSSNMYCRGLYTSEKAFGRLWISVLYKWLQRERLLTLENIFHNLKSRHPPYQSFVLRDGHSAYVLPHIPVWYSGLLLSLF